MIRSEVWADSTEVRVNSRCELRSVHKDRSGDIRPYASEECRSTFFPHDTKHTVEAVTRERWNENRKDRKSQFHFSTSKGHIRSPSSSDRL